MIKYAYLTDRGSRGVNEDSIGVFSDKTCYGFIVCDGLGGHGFGDLASSKITELFERIPEDYLMSNNNILNSSLIEEFFNNAQSELICMQKSMNCPNTLKTTAALLIMDKEYAYIGHIGDSRVYTFSNSSVSSRTHDHSVVEMLFRAGKISESEIRNHPDRNKLLNALGDVDKICMSSIEGPLNISEYQAFLLCSDGFWELINEDRMCELLNVSENVKDWLDRMEKEVADNGKEKNMDNYSAIAIWNM